MTFDSLDRKHRDWLRHSRYWYDVDLLYRGGAAIRDEAARFLVSRPVEPAEVYAQRCARFVYQNILQTAVGWYLSALFEPGPQFSIKGQVQTKTKLEAFIADADRAGKPLVGMAKEWFERMVLDGCVYVLLDLPPAAAAGSLAEQDAAGALDAFAVTYSAQQVTNWGADARGNLDWVLISTEAHSSTLGTGERCIDRWYHFDRTDYTIYESDREAKDSKGQREVRVVGSGKHAMADQRRVPVRRIAVPDSLWLAYRVYLGIIDHLNEENGLGWKLLLSNLAVPVITGGYEQPPKLSETAYIHLEKGCTFGWSEPGGGTIEVSAARLQSIREEIYRQMYLQAQARDASATAQAQSGISKQADMMPAVDVLNQFGGIFRAELAGVLRDVAAIRGDKNVEIDVHGLVAEESEPLEEIQAAMEMEIPSPTFKRHLQKRAARKLARGADLYTLAKIDAEIDAAPSDADRAKEALDKSQPEPGEEPEPDSTEE